MYRLDPDELAEAIIRVRREALARFTKGNMREARMLAGYDGLGPTLDLDVLAAKLFDPEHDDAQPHGASGHKSISSRVRRRKQYGG